MPLPPSQPRDELHARRIDVRGYRRHDDLVEVEAHIVDTKTLPFDVGSRDRMLPPGEHLHDMSIRLALDESYVIVEALAVTDAAPHRVCPSAAGSIAQLKGLKVGAGWNRAIRERLGGAQGCTHLSELLAQMATVVFQTLAPERIASEGPLDANGRPLKIDSCYAYATHREMVRMRWPEHYDGPTGSDTK